MAKEVNTRWWPSWISSERVMATFTVVIAVVAFFQWYVFANQLDEMRTDQRAWLSIKAIWATPQLNNAVAAPTVVNDVGKTAAKNVRGWVFVQSVPKNTGLAFDNPTYTEPPIGRSGEPEPAYSRFQIGVMFPNDPTTLHEAVLGERISASASPVATMWTPALKDQFERGEFYLAVRARFTYDDAAGNAHWTQFCEVVQASGQAASTPDSTSKTCMEWNAVDDNK